MTTVQTINFPFPKNNHNTKTICCRYREMSRRQQFPVFSRCVLELLQNHHLLEEKEQSLIFFTTDLSKYIPTFIEQFSSFAKVIVNPQQDDKETNRVGNYYSKIAGSNRTHPGNNLFFKITLLYINFFIFYILAMVDWFLLGECDILISSLTTFSLTSTSRTRHNQIIYTAPPGHNCKLLSEEDFIF